MFGLLHKTSSTKHIPLAEVAKAAFEGPLILSAGCLYTVTSDDIEGTLHSSLYPYENTLAFKSLEQTRSIHWCKCTKESLVAFSVDSNKLGGTMSSVVSKEKTGASLAISRDDQRALRLRGY